MTDLSGIFTQYGFEYQKKVFLHFLVFKMTYGAKLSYELLDDVDYEIDTESKGLGGTRINSTELIQCKTGTVSYDTFKHVICNWLLSEPADNYVLYIENQLSFEYKASTLKRDILEDVASYMGKDRKRRDCFLYKIYSLFNGFSADQDKIRFNDLIDAVIANLVLKVGGIEELDSETRARYIANHCADVSIQFAKDSRYKAFVDSIKDEIADAICKKEPYSIDHNHYVFLCNETITSITDEYYRYDYSRFRNNKKDIWRSMLETREAIFLRKINVSDRAIGRYLINELYYKDLREHYIGINRDDTIDALEECAAVNYDEEKRKNANHAENTFYSTIERSINDDVLNNNEYTQGCYIFLSSDEAKDDYFIDWCGENAK